MVLAAAGGGVGCTSRTIAIPARPATPSATPSATSPATSPATPSVPPAAATAAPRTTKWIDLQPGDCLAQHPPTDPAVVEVTVIDCTTPHLAEAYLRADVPVDAAVSGTASAECESGLAQYTGVPATEGSYSISYLIDSEQDRTSNNPYPSTVICLLQSTSGKVLTGSARR